MARILLTRAQAAAMLGVRPQQIVEWREREGLPCLSRKFSGGRLYSEAAVKKWAKQHGRRVYDIDRCFYQSSFACPNCGRSLMHDGKGYYKCSKGCTLPRRLGPRLDDRVVIGYD